VFAVTVAYLLKHMELRFDSVHKCVVY